MLYKEDGRSNGAVPARWLQSVRGACSWQVQLAAHHLYRPLLRAHPQRKRAPPPIPRAAARRWRGPTCIRRRRWRRRSAGRRWRCCWAWRWPSASPSSPSSPPSSPPRGPRAGGWIWTPATCATSRGSSPASSSAWGLGLTADIIDHCKLVLKFPKGTNSTWYNTQFKIFEPLEYKYDVCETILLWEQYRNMTTVLTREYLDVRPDGWLDYAAKRIAQLGADKCYNRTLCDELLSILLPAKPPFHPRQFATCAVVGNSGDLLKTEFGQEIDAHDAVFRDNEAPVNKKYAKHVGLKRDFRLVVRGAARNMAPILKGSSDEALIIKSLTHKEINAVIKELPNPVYLFQGIVLRRGAKGTGMKSIELALSMCDIIDMYGFTVDPGYTEWTRYFSAPRKGHNPLQGRAYYQLLECLGVIRIHSPMRAQRVEDWSDIPSKEEIRRAHAAAFRLKKHETGQQAELGPFSNCKVWGTVDPDYGPVSGTSDMSEARKNSNYSKWELLPLEKLRREAQEHYIQMGGVSLYKMDGNKLDDLVCVRHQRSSS
ncbi:sialyltransferase-like protein 5 isoform X1 [Setaria viridis]|uniref:sialyltransferase-like protein 5 isoform X1 n=1 Tax=Setaria viridis TaxID=4556 RepID=UPI001493CAD9|nr:sialyltransferase-like protein 5 isoform X1 [Setaria viridis]XP_034568639.1 sialyltransferase-like protein 5 isoform X1 [Setaria viridis]